MGWSVVRELAKGFLFVFPLFFASFLSARAETIPVQIEPCLSSNPIQEPFLCSLKKAVDAAKPNDRIAIPPGENVFLDRTQAVQSVNQSSADIAAYLGSTLSTAFQKGLALVKASSTSVSKIAYSGMGNHPQMPTSLPRPAYALVVNINACLGPSSLQFQIEGIQFKNVHFRFSGASCTGVNSRTKISIIESRFELYRPVYVRPCLIDYTQSPDCNLDTSTCESYTLNAVLSFRLMSEVLVSKSVLYRLPVSPSPGVADPIGNGLLLIGVSNVVVEKNYIVGRLVTAMNITPTVSSAGTLVPSTHVRVIENQILRETQSGDDALNRRKPRSRILPEDHGIYAHGFDDLLFSKNQISGWSQCATGYSLKLRNGKNLKVSDNTFYGSGVATYTYAYPVDRSWEILDHVLISNNRILLSQRGTQLLECGTAVFESVRQCMADRGVRFTPSPESIFYWSTLSTGKNEHDIQIENNRFQGDLRIFSVTDKNQWRILDNHPELGGTIQCPKSSGQILPDLTGRILPAFSCF